VLTGEKEGEDVKLQVQALRPDEQEYLHESNNRNVSNTGK